MRAGKAWFRQGNSQLARTRGLRSDGLVAGFANRLHVLADALDGVARAERQAGGDGEKGKKLTHHDRSPTKAARRESGRAGQVKA